MIERSSGPILLKKLSQWRGVLLFHMERKGKRMIVNICREGREGFEL